MLLYWASLMLLYWASLMLLYWASLILLYWASQILLYWASQMLLYWASLMLLYWARKSHSTSSLTIPLRYIFKLSSHLHIGLESVLFPSGFSTDILHSCISFSQYFACAPPILAGIYLVTDRNFTPARQLYLVCQSWPSWSLECILYILVVRMRPGAELIKG